MSKKKKPTKTTEIHRDAVCLAFAALNAAGLEGVAQTLLGSCHDLYQEIGSDVPVLGKSCNPRRKTEISDSVIQSVEGGEIKTLIGEVVEIAMGEDKSKVEMLIQCDFSDFDEMPNMLYKSVTMAMTVDVEKQLERAKAVADGC